MSQVIVITGMHRSGTSLVSSLLQKIGVNVGDQLISPNSANPRGYFEDVDFYEFHEGLLHQRAQSYLHVDKKFIFEPTGDELDRARELVAERSHRPVWGWKDPRTALFLEFWRQQLPQARFLFVYRHPIEVLLSLLRRGEFDNHPNLAAGLQAWHVYNAEILTFYERHSDQCLLVQIDEVVNQFQQFAELLQQKLQMDFQLNADTFDQIFRAEELQKTPLLPEATDVLAKLCPGLLELYHQLNSQADLAADMSRADSQAMPDFLALARFTAALSEPINLPVQQSLLQLLLSLLAPERTATMLERFNRNAQGTQQTIDQLWMRVQRLERINVEQGPSPEGQLTKLEVQQSQLLEKDLQLQRQQQELSLQAARIQSLLAELSRAHETGAGRLIQTYRGLKERWQKKTL